MRFLLTAFIFSLLINQVNELGAQEATCSKKATYLAQLKGGIKSSAADRFDVHFYKLDLHIERNSTFIEGNVSIHSAVTSSLLDTFSFELHTDFIIDSIIFNGQKRSFMRSSQYVYIQLATPMNQFNNMVTVVYYHGTAPSSSSSAIGDGFTTDLSPSWGNEVTWSLSQPFSAYEWFPVKQDLQDKADSSEVWVTTSDENMVGSNGVLENITLFPGGKHRYEWKSRHAIAYYLISVAVAKYVDYTIYAHPAGFSDSIKIVNYIYDNPATLPNFKTEIDKTAEMIELFSEKFGLYPFSDEKYGHCMAPFSGGMEHQTMTSQGYFTTDLTSHELGHQWFGDDVTCASWKDISMNEGFASYLEFVYLQVINQFSALNWLYDCHENALEPSGSVYVDDTTDVSRIFSSALTYNKGAFMLHMLRREVGNDSIFFGALKAYRIQHSGGNVTGLDLKNAVATYTGKPLAPFLQQAKYGQGYPTIDASYYQVGEKFYLVISQSPSFPSATPLFECPLDIRLHFASGPDSNITVFMSQLSEEFTFNGLTRKVTNLEIDADQWLLNEEGIIEEDPSLGISAQTMKAGIKLYPNPAREEITIDFGKTENNVGIEVFSLQGAKLQSAEMEEGESYRLSLSGDKGSRLIRLNFQDGRSEEFRVIRTE